MRSADSPVFHAEIVEPLLERRGIITTGADFGGDRFPDPAARTARGRRDLAESCIMVSGCSTKLTFIRHNSPLTEHVNLFP